jgi:hypothetical protein
MSNRAEEVSLAEKETGVTAWRAWRVQKQLVARDDEAHTHTLTYRLRSLYERYSESDEWMPQRAPHSKCRNSMRKTPAHQEPDVPFTLCSCGYSAYLTLNDLLRDIGGRAFKEIVIGEVTMWGRVLIGSELVRSAFAVPSSMYVVRNWWSWESFDAPLVAASLERYGIPSLDVHSRELPEGHAVT